MTAQFCHPALPSCTQQLSPQKLPPWSWRRTIFFTRSSFLTVLLLRPIKYLLVNPGFGMQFIYCQQCGCKSPALNKQHSSEGTAELYQRGFLLQTRNGKYFWLFANPNLATFLYPKHKVVWLWKKKIHYNPISLQTQGSLSKWGHLEWFQTPTSGSTAHILGEVFGQARMK